MEKKGGEGGKEESVRAKEREREKKSALGRKP